MAYRKRPICKFLAVQNRISKVGVDEREGGGALLDITLGLYNVTLNAGRTKRDNRSTVDMSSKGDYRSKERDVTSPFEICWSIQGA